MTKKLKSVMAAKHITGYRLAQLTKISTSDIYQALKGQKPMFNGWKKRIADALEMTVDELFPEDGDADE